LREELGLAYEVSSFFPTRWLSSEWVIYSRPSPGKLPLARKELERILNALIHRPPRADEVQQAIAMIKGSFLMEQQTRRRQAWYTAWWEFLGKGHDYNKHFIGAIERNHTEASRPAGAPSVATTARNGGSNTSRA